MLIVSRLLSQDNRLVPVSFAKEGSIRRYGPRFGLHILEAEARNAR
jgi:hypothetical protein